jgi:hypothetical protein
MESAGALLVADPFSSIKAKYAKTIPAVSAAASLLLRELK